MNPLASIHGDGRISSNDLVGYFAALGILTIGAVKASIVAYVLTQGTLWIVI
jgi:hypothetical protein